MFTLLVNSCVFVLHSVFAVKPAGTRDLAEAEEMHINESPEEVPSLGKHKLTV